MRKGLISPLNIIAVVLSFCFLSMPVSSQVKVRKLKKGNIETAGKLKITSESEIIAQLGVKKGMSVVELLAGEGKYAFDLATVVGDSGKVYVNDLSSKALEKVKSRALKENKGNVVTVHGSQKNAHLPRKKIDVMILDPGARPLSQAKEMLASLRSSLSEKGRLFIIAWDPDDHDKTAGLKWDPEDYDRGAAVRWDPEDYDHPVNKVISQMAGLGFRHLGFNTSIKGAVILEFSIK